MTLDTVKTYYTVEGGKPRFPSRRALQLAAAEVPNLVDEVEHLRTENARLRRQLQEAASWKALLEEARATAAHAAGQEMAVPAEERL